MIGKLKDAQAVLAAHPDKRLKLIILVADIPASYGMLLNKTFRKDMGGEIKMDWSEAIIPMGNKKVHLAPEVKSKYTILPSDDPKSYILYEECQFGNYFI